MKAPADGMFFVPLIKCYRNYLYYVHSDVSENSLRKRTGVKWLPTKRDVGMKKRYTGSWKQEMFQGMNLLYFINLMRKKF